MGAAKSVGKQTLRKQLDSGSEQRRVNPKKLPNKLFGYVETFFQTSP